MGESGRLGGKLGDAEHPMVEGPSFFLIIRSWVVARSKAKPMLSRFEREVGVTKAPHQHKRLHVSGRLPAFFDPRFDRRMRSPDEAV